MNYKCDRTRFLVLHAENLPINACIFHTVFLLFIELTISIWSGTIFEVFTIIADWSIQYFWMAPPWNSTLCLKMFLCYAQRSLSSLEDDSHKKEERKNGAFPRSLDSSRVRRSYPNQHNGPNQRSYSFHHLKQGERQTMSLKDHDWDCVLIYSTLGLKDSFWTLHVQRLDTMGCYQNILHASTAGLSPPLNIIDFSLISLTTV